MQNADVPLILEVIEAQGTGIRVVERSHRSNHDIIYFIVMTKMLASFGTISQASSYQVPTHLTLGYLTSPIAETVALSS